MAVRALLAAALLAPRRGNQGWLQPRKCASSGSAPAAWQALITRSA